MKKFVSMFSVLLIVLFASIAIASAATLMWDASTGATGYEMRYREVGGTTWTPVSTTDVFFDLGPLSLIEGTRYEFQVFATDGTNWSSGSDILRWTMYTPQIIEIIDQPNNLSIDFGI